MKKISYLIFGIYLAFFLATEVKAIDVVDGQSVDGSLKIYANGTSYSIAKYKSTTGGEFLSCRSDNTNLTVTSKPTTDQDSECYVSSKTPDIKDAVVKVYIEGGINGEEYKGTIKISTLKDTDQSQNNVVTDVDSDVLSKKDCNTTTNVSIAADGNSHDIGQIVKTNSQTGEYGGCESSDSRVLIRAKADTGQCLAYSRIPNLSNIVVTLKYYDGKSDGKCVGKVIVSTVAASSNETTNNQQLDMSSFNVCDATANPGVMAGFKLGSIAIDIIKIVVPILLIVFGMIDMSKIVVEGKEDSIGKSAATFGKRAGAAILIFLAPTLILTVFDYISGWYGVEYKFQKCLDCLLDTSKCPDNLTITGGTSNNTTNSNTNNSSNNNTNNSSTNNTNNSFGGGGHAF